MIKIQSGGYHVSLSPEHGGQVVDASYLGKEIFRSAELNSSSCPLMSGCFPLVPYSNRIIQGQFRMSGKDVTVKNNWNVDPHAIHGEGWQAVWSVLEHSDSNCRLSYIGGSNWPWDYSAEQHVSVSESGIRFKLIITNTGTDEMPIGLGFHPYFPRSDKTEIRFSANKSRPPIRDSLPDFSPVSSENCFKQSRRVDACDLDHCFGGWDGFAEIIDPDRSLKISVNAENYSSWAVLFIPPGEDFFCFEPVSHANGALNSEDPPSEGIFFLKPGEKQAFEMRISAQFF